MDSFLGSWLIIYEDGVESLLQINADGNVAISSANSMSTGMLKAIQSVHEDWQYEFVSNSQTEQKLFLKVVDGQLVVRLWTGTHWISSASVQTASSTESKASEPLASASSGIPVWILISGAIVIGHPLIILAFVCRSWRSRFNAAPQHIVQDVAHDVTPPTLLRREISTKSEKNSELRTSSVDDDNIIDDADVELELGLGDDFDNVSSLVSPQAGNATSFQGVVSTVASV
jgi:hypothetical protein